MKQIPPRTRSVPTAAALWLVSGIEPTVTAEAKGATSRFLQVYDEYKKAPDVTRQRMYLETMERLFGGTDKIIVDQGGGVVPYLPLDQLTRRPQTPPQTGGSR